MAKSREYRWRGAGGFGGQRSPRGRYRIQSGRFAGNTLAEVYSLGPDGREYVEWAARQSNDLGMAARCHLADVRRGRVQVG